MYELNLHGPHAASEAVLSPKWKTESRNLQNQSSFALAMPSPLLLLLLPMLPLPLALWHWQCLCRHWKEQQQRQQKEMRNAIMDKYYLAAGSFVISLLPYGEYEHTLPLRLFSCLAVELFWCCWYGSLLLPCCCCCCCHCDCAFCGCVCHVRLTMAWRAQLALLKKSGDAI